VELIDEVRQNIQLAHRAELFRDVPKPSIQLPSRRAIKREQRKQFAKSPRCDASAVQRLDAAQLHIGQPARERIESFLK
jgi:hypothetical protein